MIERDSERMSPVAFRLMTAVFRVVDIIFPRIDRRVGAFDIREGMIVVDYGCGPGRYTAKLARLVGSPGFVYAVDIHELAIGAVERKIQKLGLKNVKPVLANGYDSTLPTDIADVVCALDMFFGIKDPPAFLGELRRILKPQGTLIIDDGHQRRSTTRQKIMSSGVWAISEESRDHLKCKPV